eukprot:TRINITY_DN2157_c2_g1_i1.p2 TRINITY_DN2157_c2_g1~~TRINITY_DN2157_c2_g1_i1.p2  ORF type:complete len:339 (+),score=101.44 TRINITY_DN2157_c2_g1_i1:80-1096(+)
MRTSVFYIAAGWLLAPGEAVRPVLDLSLDNGNSSGRGAEKLGRASLQAAARGVSAAGGEEAAVGGHNASSSQAAAARPRKVVKRPGALVQKTAAVAASAGGAAARASSGGKATQHADADAVATPPATAESNKGQTKEKEKEKENKLKLPPTRCICLQSKNNDKWFFNKMLDTDDKKFGDAKECTGKCGAVCADKTMGKYIIDKEDAAKLGVPFEAPGDDVLWSGMLSSAMCIKEKCQCLDAGGTVKALAKQGEAARLEGKEKGTYESLPECLGECDGRCHSKGQVGMCLFDRKFGVSVEKANNATETAPPLQKAGASRSGAFSAPLLLMLPACLMRWQ